MKTAFLLKNNWIEIFDNLSDKQAGLLIKSLFKYNVNGEKPADLTDIEVKAYFNVMLLDCKTMNENYDKRCDTSVENGKLGGRPKKTENQVDKKPKKPNSKPNNLNNHDNDNDKSRYENEIEVNPPTPFETNFNFDFCDDKWRRLIERWMNWLRTKNKRVTTQEQVNSIYQTLTFVENLTFSDAEKTVEYSISNGWGMLVVPDSIKDLIKQKNKQNEKPKKEIYLV